jgi:hypothetical protein
MSLVILGILKVTGYQEVLAVVPALAFGKVPPQSPLGLTPVDQFVYQLQ